jgi:hypothetical protein
MSDLSTKSVATVIEIEFGLDGRKRGGVGLQGG